jgi:hypothetical protein
MPRSAEVGENIMASIKDFQEETAQHIFELFTTKDTAKHQDRILLADEVGLGKTIVANRVLNKLTRWYEDVKKKPIKVVYICSNLSIMQQNCYKLDLFKKTYEKTFNGRSFNLSENRLSMQHLIYAEMLHSNTKASQLIPMSANTSFTMTEGTGTAEERKLMYVILKGLDDNFIKNSGKLERMLKMDVSKVRWKKENLHKNDDNTFEKRVMACGEKRYLIPMRKKVKLALQREDYLEQDGNENYKKSLYDEIIFLCENSTRINWKNEESKNTYRHIITRLRHIFANISLEALQPDLVVMDEFQRFKSLLNPETEEGKMLADKFLSTNYSEKIQVLLLSATPYKLYSTLEETNDPNEDHYKEFKDVVGYLIDNRTSEKTQVSKVGKDFNDIWNEYSACLREFFANNVNGETLIKKKETAEDELYKHISRTERINDKYNTLGNSTWDDINSLIDNSKAKVMDKVTDYDFLAYIEMQKLMNKLKLGYFPLIYAKSAPFLMSFMNDYKVNKQILNAFKNLKNQDKRELIAKTSTLWLNYTDINRYHGIYVTQNGKHKANTPSNSRLEVLFKEVFYNAMPNDEQIAVKPLRNGIEKLLWLPATFPYYRTNNNEFEANRGYSKVLIFSKWAMVPRMIAGLTTYEAARLLNEDVRNLTNKKMKRDANKRQYLNDTKNRGGRLSDDKNTVGSGTLIKYASKFLARMYVPKEHCSKELDTLITDIKEKIANSKEFSNIPIKFTPKGKLGAKNLVILLQLLDAEKDNKEYLDILEENQIRDDKLDLGNNHRDKVLKLLAYIAIGGPGVCAYRIFSADNKATEKAEKLGESLKDLFNGPFETDVVDAFCKNEDAGTYYERVLRYCVEGNLQAVLDEYAYTLGIDDKGILCTEMCKAFIKTVDIRVNVKNKKQNKVREKPEKQVVALPTNFAVGYFDASDTQNAQRTTNIRIAFNSPFWPFVLASTSIGQEGLDFHQYCRKVMHWNLPFNPIDLEQREGRINRYLSLAIRLNLVDYYKQRHKGFVTNNIWNDIVNNAKALKGNYSDMVPFWNLPPVRAWKYKIERIVPMYPYSQDVLRYERIIKILGLYRLTLGQERQEELIATIGRKDLDKQQQRKLLMNLAPYFREKAHKK